MVDYYWILYSCPRYFLRRYWFVGAKMVVHKVEERTTPPKKQNMVDFFLAMKDGPDIF